MSCTNEEEYKNHYLVRRAVFPLQNNAVPKLPLEAYPQLTDEMRVAIGWYKLAK